MSLLVLTGATGLVASAFGKMHEGRVLALGRDWGALGEHRGEVTGILHCAADTRFGAPLAELRAANVERTRELLEYALRCPRLERFGYVSTVFSAGQRQGLIAEEAHTGEPVYSNPYQQSKREAEDLVVAAMAEMPAACYRLSSIVADNADGRVTQFNHCHQLMRLLARNVLPVAPGLATAPVDLIPLDWAVQRLHRLFVDEFRAGQVAQICAGPRGSLTVQEMVDLAVRVYETHPAGKRWLPLRAPRLVGLEEFTAWSADAAHDPLLRELLRVLSFFLPHLGLDQRFANEAGGDSGSLPAAASLFTRTVEYCLATNWGKG